MPTDGRPNVVLVTADSVRADDCSFLHPGPSTTPTLEGMTDDGVSFANAVSPGPRTPSSVPEIMTGERMPNDTVDPADWEERIARVRAHMANSTSLAERLKDAGYSTIAYTSNPWTGTFTEFDAGFDVFRKNGKRNSLDLNVFADTGLEPISQTADQWVKRVLWRPMNGIGSFARWPQFIEEILASVESVERPYFLWVFLLDSHSPFLVPREDRHESSIWQMAVTQTRANSFLKDSEVGDTTSYQGSISPGTRERLRGMYRDSIRSVDRFVWTLWNAVAGDDPLLVFHSDHGEAFGEHGTFGHQRELYEENVHVPLFVYNSEASGTVDEVVTLRDVGEMIRSYVTEAVPFTDPRWHEERAVLRTEDNSKFGIRTERWKYVRHGGDEQLFDLLEDPRETTNVADEHDTTVAELDESLERYVRTLPRGDGYRPGGVDPDTETRLSDLGYIE